MTLGRLMTAVKFARRQDLLKSEHMQHVPTLCVTSSIIVGKFKFRIDKTKFQLPKLVNTYDPCKFETKLLNILLRISTKEIMHSRSRFLKMSPHIETLKYTLACSPESYGCIPIATVFCDPGFALMQDHLSFPYRCLILIRYRAKNLYFKYDASSGVTRE